MIWLNEKSKPVFQRDTFPIFMFWELLYRPDMHRETWTHGTRPYILLKWEKTWKHGARSNTFPIGQSGQQTLSYIYRWFLWRFFFWDILLAKIGNKFLRRKIRVSFGYNRLSEAMDSTLILSMVCSANLHTSPTNLKHSTASWNLPICSFQGSPWGE